MHACNARRQLTNLRRHEILNLPALLLEDVTETRNFVLVKIVIEAERKIRLWRCCWPTLIETVAPGLLKRCCSRGRGQVESSELCLLTGRQFERLGIDTRNQCASSEVSQKHVGPLSPSGARNESVAVACDLSWMVQG